MDESTTDLLLKADALMRRTRSYVASPPPAAAKPRPAAPAPVAEAAKPAAETPAPLTQRAGRPS